MADYYWVGGTGTWNGSSTTNWASSSGGSGGAGVPTASDNAIFDSLSNATGYTCNIASGATCLSVTFGKPLTGDLTIGSTGTLTVYGSYTNDSSNIVITRTGFTIFSSTTTGNTITTNGLSIGGSVTLNGVGGEWTLGSDFACNSTFTVTNGSFITSNYNMSIVGFVIGLASAGSVNLGSSTLTSTGTTFTISSTNLTLTSSSSSLVFTPTISGNAPQVTFNIPTGLTFANVSVSHASSNKCIIFSIGNSFTCSSTFTATGLNETSRVIVWDNSTSISYGIKTITAATFVSSYCDYAGTTAAGAGAPMTGTSLGDIGANSGITFTSPKTVYWNLGGSVDWIAGWASSSGGSPAAANFPLAQDTIIFDESGSAGTISVGTGEYYVCPSPDLSSRSTSFTLTTNTRLRFVGNASLNSSLSVSNDITYYMASGISNTFTQGGSSLVGIRFEGPGTMTAAADITSTGTFVTANGPTFDADTYNINATTFTIANNGVLYMGSGNWTASGTGTVFSSSTGNTIYGETSTLILSNTSTTSRAINAVASNFNNLEIGGSTGTSILSIFNGPTFNTISSTKTVAHTILFHAGNTTTMADFTVVGTSGNEVTIGSTSAAAATIAKTGGGTITTDYAIISYSTATPSSTWYATNSTDNGNNTGWTFGSPPGPGGTGNFFLLF